MSEKFTASNGQTVAIVDGDLMVGNPPLALSPVGVAAMREFFLHERDQELGRWRSKLHPEWTGVVDVCEFRFRTDDGLREFTVAKADREYRQWSHELREVAKEYLAAHPLPKPWHDAKPGEVWEMTYVQLGERERVRPFSVDANGRFRDSQGVVMPFDFDNLIVASRRIWPEAVES